jgi:hypothetical protein
MRLLLSLRMIVMLAIRAVLEERTLTAELEGYAAYAMCAIDSCRVFGRVLAAGNQASFGPNFRPCLPEGLAPGARGQAATRVT